MEMINPFNPSPEQLAAADEILETQDRSKNLSRVLQSDNTTTVTEESKKYEEIDLRRARIEEIHEASNRVSKPDEHIGNNFATPAPQRETPGFFRRLFGK
jgi:hypothetical protein